MSRLIKIADWDGGVRVNVVFVHGLGGHAYDTWRRNGDDGTLWPAWLARDIPGLSAWTLSYDAPPSNWLGTGMALQDRAKNVLECLLGQSGLKGAPLVFVCHSLGGLVVKQVLRTVDGRRAFGAAEAAFLDSVKGVVFIATPHTGSLHATLLDRLRLVAWPSASTLDLVKNDAGLRDLNVWYRNGSGGIRHKVFYEKRGTTAGIIVADDSSDPGLLRVDPVPVDADHVEICKPAAAGDLVYARTRDFIVEEIVAGETPGVAWGTLRRLALPALPRPRSRTPALVSIRAAIILIVGLISFRGVQALLFPPDLLGAASIEQIDAALRAKSPRLTAEQVDQFIQSLRELRGEPSFGRAVGEATMGNTHVAEGILRQIYENRIKERQKSEKEAAEAARNLAAIAVVGNAVEGLKWYQQATSLDPNNMAGWLGLGDAAMDSGVLREADRGYLRYVELARRNGDDRETTVGVTRHGDVLVAQGHLSEALQSFRDGLAIRERLAQSDLGNAGWQRDLSISHNRIGDVLVEQGHLPEALKSFRGGLAIRNRLAQADPGNAGRQRDLSVSFDRVGDGLLAQGHLLEALKSFRDSLAIAERLAQSDPGNARWQRDLSVSYSKIGDVLVARGNLPEALKSFRDGLALRNRLALTDPGNAVWQRNLSVSFDRVGDMLALQGHLPEALKSFRDGLAIAERLAQSDPGNAGWQRDLSVSFDLAGDVLAAQGHLPEALKWLRDGLAIAERLAQSDPGNAQWQRDLSVSFDHVGDVLMMQGDLPEALKSFRDGMAIRNHLAQSDPGNAGWQRDLSVSYAKIGELLAAQGNLPEALRSFCDGLAIAERLARSDPGNASWQRDLSASYTKIGEAQTEQGNLPEALQSFHDGLAIAERLAQSDAGNAVWQRDLSVSLDRIGDVLVAQDRLPEALKSFRDGLAIADQLARSDPSNAAWQRDLSVSYEKIGDALVAEGHLPEALKSFRTDLAIAERPAQSDPDNAGWQFDLVVSHWKLAANGDDAPRRFAFIVATLRKLKEENRLTPQQEKWFPEAEGQLEKMR